MIRNPILLRNAQGDPGAELRDPLLSGLLGRSSTGQSQRSNIIGYAPWEAGSMPMPTMLATRCRSMSYASRVALLR